MKQTWLKLGLSAGLMGLLAAPAILVTPFNAHAGIDFTVGVGRDDAAHFDFNDRHVNPKIMRAANDLRDAKHKLWELRDDFGGHRDNAIQAINEALDQLRMTAEHRHHD